MLTGRSWIPRLSLLILLLLPLLACQPGQRDKLNLSGSSTVAPLLMEIGKRFEDLNPGVRVDVQTGGSTRGVNDMRKGLVDIGMASRALKPSEQDLVSHTVAWDGISLLLNQENPVMSLSRQQVIDIYSGRITNWTELGGPDKSIVVVNKAEGRSTLELFLHYYQLHNADVKAHIIIGDNQQALKTVAGNAWAIAYVSIGAARYELNHGAPLKMLAIDGIEATLQNVKKGIFPIARPLNLISSSKTSALGMRFIDFAQSKAVADLVNKQFFVAANAS